MSTVRTLLVAVVLACLVIPSVSFAEPDEATMFIQAKNHFQESNYYFASTWLERILKKFPTSPRREEALMMLAKSYASTSRDEKAIRTLKTLLKEFPKSAGKIEPGLLKLVPELSEQPPPRIEPAPAAAPVPPAKTDVAPVPAQVPAAAWAVTKKATEKAATEKAATEKAATEKAAAEKAAAEKAAAEKAAAEKAAAEKAAAEKAAADTAIADKVSPHKVAAQIVAAETAAAEKAAAEKPASRNMTVEEATAQRAAAIKVAVEKAAAEKAAAAKAASAVLVAPVKAAAVAPPAAKPAPALPEAVPPVAAATPAAPPAPKAAPAEVPQPQPAKVVSTPSEPVLQSAPAPVASGIYTLEFGTYVLKSEMVSVKKKIKSAGMKPVVEPGPKKMAQMSRIHVGEYADQKAAEKTLQKLRKAKAELFVLQDKGGSVNVYAGSYLDKIGAVDEQLRLAGFGITTELRQTAVQVPTFVLTAGSFKSQDAAARKGTELERLGVKPTVVPGAPTK